MSAVASPAFVVSSSVHALFSVATKQGVKFVHPAVFPTPPSLLWSLKESESREEEEETVGRGEGGRGAFHRHAKTFRGKPSQIFPTVCGEGFASPVTHTHTHTHTLRKC